MPKRRSFSAEFKAKVALEALREQSTLAEIAQKYELHQKQISTWKKEALESMSSIFTDKRRKDKDLKGAQQNIDELHKKVGELTMERDFLKNISCALLGWVFFIIVGNSDAVESQSKADKRAPWTSNSYSKKRCNGSVVHWYNWDEVRKMGIYVLQIARGSSHAASRTIQLVSKDN